MVPTTCQICFRIDLSANFGNQIEFTLHLRHEIFQTVIKNKSQACPSSPNQPASSSDHQSEIPISLMMWRGDGRSASNALQCYLYFVESDEVAHRKRPSSDR